MAEYIERQAAIDLFYPVDPENDGSDGCTVVYKTENYTSDEIEAVISGLPAADVAPVRHGRWVAVRRTNASTVYQCSVCERKVSVMNIGAAVWDHYPYCHCGAKMDADE